MPDDRLRHALPEETHERIFRQAIVPDVLPASAPLVSPTAVILGGQPGAGKTALLHQATQDLARLGPTVVINGDDFRSYHPSYGELQRTDPLNAARYTDHDSGRWVEKLIAAAQEQRVNLVIESTMRRPEVFVRTGGQLRAAGYGLEARAMAVPERLSWQGVHHRYEAMLAAGGSARFTARDAHDAGASGMVETLARIERDRLADRVLLSTRAGTVIYDNALDGAAWRQPAAAAERLLEERSRPRTPAELGAIERGWVGVIDSMQRRQAPAEELGRVVNQAANDVLFFRQAADTPRSWPTVPARPGRNAGETLRLAVHDKRRTDAAGVASRIVAATSAAQDAPSGGRVSFGQRIADRQSRPAPATPTKLDTQPLPDADPDNDPLPRRPGPGVS